MATYDPPIDSQTDPDAPLTSNLGKRWDNNVVAFIEQDSSSPIGENRFHPYDRSTVGGSEDGKIRDFATEGSAAFYSPVLAPEYEYSLRFFGVLGSSGTNIVVEFRDTVDAVIATRTFGTLDPSTQFDTRVEFFAGDYSGADADPDLSGGVVSRVYVYNDVGTFSAGRVYLYKELGGLR